MDEKFFRAISNIKEDKKPKRSSSYNKVRSSNYSTLNKTKLRGASYGKVKRINVPMNPKFFKTINSSNVNKSKGSKDNKNINNISASKQDQNNKDNKESNLNLTSNRSNIVYLT